MPLCFSVPSLRSLIAAMTAEGVGIMIPEMSSEALVIPFALMMFLRNTSRITF